MKKQLNLVTAFIIGLLYIPDLYVYTLPSDGHIDTISLKMMIVLLVIVLTSFIFAIRSIVKKESRVGAIIIILGDLVLFMLSILLYTGIDP